jgi:hypothetical protein
VAVFDLGVFDPGVFDAPTGSPSNLTTTGYTAGDEVFFLGLEVKAQSSAVSIQSGPFTDYWNGSTQMDWAVSCSGAAFFLVGVLGYDPNTGEPAQRVTAVSGGGLTWFKLAGGPVNNGQMALEYWGAYSSGAASFTLSVTWNNSCYNVGSVYALAGVKSSSPAGDIAGPSVCGDNLTVSFYSYEAGSYLFAMGYRWPINTSENVSGGPGTTVYANVYGVTQHVRSTSTTTRGTLYTVDLSESTSLVESVGGLAGFAVAPATETISLSENRTTIALFSVPLSDSESSVEGTTVVMTMKPSVSEATGVNESLGIVAALKPAVTESVSVADSLIAQLLAVGNLTDAVGLAEQISPLYKAVESLNEVIGESEAINSTDGVDLSESLGLSESISVVLSALATASEAIAQAEQIAGLTIFKATASESESSGESVEVARSTAVFLSEGQEIGEEVDPTVMAVAGVQETLDLAEELGATWAAIVEVGETDTIIEAVNIQGGLDGQGLMYVRMALMRAVLDLLGSTFPVEVENIPLPTKPANATWAQVYFVPTSRKVANVTEDHIAGQLVVRMNYPRKTGNEQYRIDGDRFRQNFTAGRPFTQGLQSVRILSCGRSPGKPAANWYQGAITISWFALVPR